MAKFERGMTEAEQEELSKYVVLLNKAQDIFAPKIKDMQEARQALKQIMPQSIKTNASQVYDIIGNTPDDREQQGTYNNTSTYMMPFLNAMIDKQKSELQVHNAAWQFEANKKALEAARVAVEHNIRQTFSIEEIQKKINLFIEYFASTGTVVTQTYPKNVHRKVIKNGEPETYYSGKGIDIKIYDPITVLLDYNADPQDVTNTSEWIIVTLGTFTSDYIKNKWGVDLEITQAANQIIDSGKRQAEVDSGTVKRNEVVVREFYRNNGKKYMVFGDSILYEEGYTKNGYADRIPLQVSKLFFDPDCVYGLVPWVILKPHIEVASTAINQICDNNSRNNNSPIFTWAGSGFANSNLNETGANEIVELNPSGVIGQQGMDINKMVTKLQWPDVTPGAQVMLQVAERNALAVYGMSSLDFGQQEKQIRTNDVAQLIGQSSLRNSSNLVIRFESEFMNPVASTILQIMYIYFDEFEWPENVTREMLADIKGIRIANGSYLPSDKMDRIQKMSVVKNEAAMNPTQYDHEKVQNDFLQAVGVVDPDVYLMDPLEKMQEAGLVQMVALAQQMGPEALTQMFAQFMQQQQQGGEQ